MTVTAWVGGNLCGQGVLTEVAGYGVAYVVDVMAEDWEEWSGCGAPGREVRFRVREEEMVPPVVWDNREVEEVDLRPLSRVYLPLVMAGYAHAPDLVVDELIATAEAITVVIRNRGPAAAVDAFWVDVYINPEPVPTKVDQVWNELAEEGLVWGVTAAVEPGEAITLTIGGEYYYAEYSRFTGGMDAGTWVYAQVDSVGAGTAYGAVRETHEITGGSYNNIKGILSE